MASVPQISAKALEPPLRVLEGTGISLEEVFAGTSIEPAYLSRGSARVTWDDFAVLFDRLETIAGGPEGFERAGSEFLKAPRFRVFLRFLTMVASVKSLYRFAIEIGGPQLFPIFKNELTILGDGHLRIHMTLPDDCRPCDAYYRFTAGSFRALPRILGCEDSVVEYSISGRNCTFDVRHVRHVGLFDRIRLWFFTPFAAASAYKEIVERNQEMQGRLIELTASRREAEEARIAAERASQVKSEILRNVTHELRTPLNAVIGLSELLREHERDGGRRESVEEILTAGNAMNRLIDKLLKAANPSAAVRDELFDLNALVRETITTESIIVDASLASPSRTGDAKRLRTIVSELADNAIKFSSGGPVAIKVFEEEASWVRLEIADEGIGIAEDRLPFIFDAFQQGDGSLTRRAGGMGLGLSIVKSAVETLRGTITVESTVGRGTRVIVRIPLAITEKIESVLEPQRATTSTETPTRVLVVEDNLVNQKVLVRMLDRIGADVATAANGIEALERVRSAPFDLILMDCQMPEMDGFEATRNIRAFDQPIAKTPIIAVTAHGDEDYEHVCRAAGMDGYLPKPVRKKEIEGLIDRIRAEMRAR